MSETGKDATSIEGGSEKLTIQKRVLDWMLRQDVATVLLITLLGVVGYYIIEISPKHEDAREARFEAQLTRSDQRVDALHQQSKEERQLIQEFFREQLIEIVKSFEADQERDARVNENKDELIKQLLLNKANVAGPLTKEQIDLVFKSE